MDFFKNKILGEANKWIILILFTVGLAWIDITEYGFYFDDFLQIRPYDLNTLIHCFTHRWSLPFIPAYYRPFLTLFFAITSWISLNPVFHHLVSIILHVLNVYLLYLNLKIYFKDERISLFSSLLFGLFPLSAGAVSWISDQGILIVVALMLLAWLNLQRRKGSIGLRVIILVVSAVLFKESAYLIPSILLGLSLGRWDFKKQNLFTKVLTCIIAAISCIFIIFLSLALIRTIRNGNHYFVNSYILNIFRYTTLTFASKMAWIVYLVLLLCFGLILFYIFIKGNKLTRIRASGFMLAFFLSTVSGFISINYRYQYMPGIFFCILLGYAICKVRKPFYYLLFAFIALGFYDSNKSLRQQYLYIKNPGIDIQFYSSPNNVLLPWQREILKKRLGSLSLINSEGRIDEKKADAYFTSVKTAAEVDFYYRKYLSVKLRLRLGLDKKLGHDIYDNF